MGWGRGIVAGFAVLALLVLAAPAGAVRQEVARMPAFSPQVAAGDAVFLSRASGRTRVIYGAPGQPPLEIGSLPDPPGADPECCSQEYSTALAADGSYAAASRRVVLYAKGALAEDSFSIDAGPVNSKLGRLYACGGNHPFDVDAGRIAYVDGCVSAGGPNSPIVVRDLTAPDAPVVQTVPVSGATVAIDLAGQHLAIGRIATGNVTETLVHDLSTNSQAYKVPHLNTMSLQADGKLAVQVGSGSGCHIDWYSRAEPVPHTIDVCPVEGMRLEGDRIAVGRMGGPGATIDLLTLGGASTTVASFASGSLLNGFDFDDGQLTYAVGGCSTPEDVVYLDDLAGPPPATEGGPCPASISGSRVRATSSGKVTVRFKCPDGCSGFLTLRRGGTQVVRSVAFLNEPRGTRKATMRLTNSARRLLRDRGSLVVQARLQADQRGPGPRTFKRAIRVLAPR